MPAQAAGRPPVRLLPAGLLALLPLHWRARVLPPVAASGCAQQSGDGASHTCARAGGLPQLPCPLRCRGCWHSAAQGPPLLPLLSLLVPLHVEAPLPPALPLPHPPAAAFGSAPAAALWRAAPAAMAAARSTTAVRRWRAAARHTSTARHGAAAASPAAAALAGRPVLQERFRRQGSAQASSVHSKQLERKVEPRTWPLPRPAQPPVQRLRVGFLAQQAAGCPGEGRQAEEWEEGG